MKNTLTDIFKSFAIYLLLCVVTFLMLRTISLYLTFDSNAAFLSQKQEYIDNTIWKTAFYIHVFSSVFVLLAGFTQFSSQLLRNHRKVHRWLGRFYAYNIFFINFPAGLIMAIYANGFFPTKVAFVTLDCFWFWFTLKAVIEIRRKNIRVHKEYMIRSYALTFSAITLRTWKLILSNLFNIDPMTLYMIDAWLGFIPNLLFAEWLISRNKSKLSAKTNICYK